MAVLQNRGTKFIAEGAELDDAKVYNSGPFKIHQQLQDKHINGHSLRYLLETYEEFAKIIGIRRMALLDWRRIRLAFLWVMRNQCTLFVRIS